MRFSELEGATVGVWGAGREVGSFARQLARRLPKARIAVAVFDSPPTLDASETLQAPDVRIVGSAEAPVALTGCDVLVRSPGVSIHRPELVALREAGVPVTTATALWLAERGGAGVIGVTGTKGKSTTAALAAHIARAAGRSVRLAGNIGAPALDLLDEDDAEVTVVELSSFHIADLDVGPEVALVTNVFREHTDWHGSEEAYRADKLRILGLPGVRVAVVGEREKRVARAHPDVEVAVFGVPGGWEASAEGISRDGEEALARSELPLHGEHNALNLCGALTALEALGIATPELRPALADFRPLAHRLETVLERDGVTWIDDSISTTPESALAALASFPGRDVILIGGGQDRGQDYAQLAHALAERGASVIGVPSTGSRLVAAAREAGVDDDHALDAVDMAGAVELSQALATTGAVVLLSPAAPSYDHYTSFEERGECFRALAQLRR
ncbi:MAG TPA: UDP-N-acetylmuramoyl-L-alanine--D-glutamate ligase [Solirubrobacteraceae bacterium]|nr:UDP-N-acetylmuramoyl-L-alanine--D-glutamate ligase [Solirubrobacteraceae bacterium]